MSALAFFARKPAAPAEPFRKTKAVHALTSSASNEAYTPPDVLAAGRASLGGTIDLDPASCAVANEEVRATFWCDADNRMLHRPWSHTVKCEPVPSRVWLNPPGGFVNRETFEPAKRGMSSACAWWRKLLDEYRAGRVRAACFYVFRLDVLQNVQALDGYEPPHAFPFCIFKQRPRHWHNGQWKDQGDGKPPKWEPPILGVDRGKKGQPTHACGVFFLPERGAGYNSPSHRTVGGPLAWAKSTSLELFRDSFAPLGYVR